MPTLVHEYDWPDRVVVGTIGRPGQRTFYLQARAGTRSSAVVLEKEQSALLAEKVDELLDALMAEDGNPFSVPAGTPVELLDDDPLDSPVEPDFRAGVMSLAWDPRTAQVVLQAYPVPDDGDDDAGADEPDEPAEPAESLVVRMPVGTARAFADRARRVVGAGRPPCPRCGAPLDEDHVCPVPDGR